MDGNSHRMMSRLAIELLPPEERQFWLSDPRLIDDYCLYPDQYVFSGVNYDEALLDRAEPRWRDFVQIDGSHLHYHVYNIMQPDTAVTLMEHLVGGALDANARGDRERMMIMVGCLLHILQDISSPAHSAEEFDLRTIAPPPPEFRDHSLHALMEIGRPIDPSPVEHTPELLALDRPQAIMHTMLRVLEQNRFCFAGAVRMLYSIYDGREQEANAVFREAARRCVTLSADILHTIYMLVSDQVGQPEKQRLSHCELQTIRPIKIEQDQNYLDYTVDQARNLYDMHRPVPLELNVGRNGQSTPRRFDHGIATMTDAGGRTRGLHAALRFRLYPEAYQRLRMLAGIHPRIARAGHLKLSVLCDDKPVWVCEHVRREDSAHEIEADISQASTLTLLAESAPGENDLREVGNIDVVWAEPMLLR